MNRLPSRLTPIDYALSAAASALAIWSIYSSIGRDDLARLMVIVTCLCHAGGYFLFRSVRQSPVLAYSGWCFFALAVGCYAFREPLNMLLPSEREGVFPDQLISAGAFCWVVALSGMTAWSGEVLCFQAVPSLALFSLVGSFDQTKNAPFLFFAFLLLIISLFFRTHARSMLAQAQQALAPFSDRRPDRHEVQQLVMDSGAWRWMAGPEWAVGSALVVILLSLLGAPTIHRVVRDNIGQIVPPRAIPQNQNSNGSNFDVDSETLQVGRSAPKFSGTTVLTTSLRQGYLRGGTLDTYEGGRWTRALSRTKNDFSTNEDLLRFASFEVRNGQHIEYSYRIVSGRHGSIYGPGDITAIRGPDIRFTQIEEGSVRAVPPLSAGEEILAQAVLPAAVHRYRVPEYNGQSIWWNIKAATPRLRQFAADAVAGMTDSYQKAQKLTEAVGHQCRYNLRATAVSDDPNPVDAFLFHTQEGYCDLFASALCLCLRSQGLPARLATGFIVQPEQHDERGQTVIQDSDYHVWCEVFFNDVGWVPFDATAYAQDITPLDAKLHKDGFQIPLPAKLAGGVLGLLTLAFFVRKLRLAPTQKQVRAKVPESEKQWRRFQRIVERKVRRPRRLGETGAEFLDRVGPLLGEHRDRVLDAFHLCESMLFSNHPPSSAAVKATLNDLARHLRR